MTDSATTEGASSPAPPPAPATPAASRWARLWVWLKRLRAGRTQVNSRVADGQTLHNSSGLVPSVPVQHAEYPFELFYNINFTHWLSVSPAIQYVHSPGGISANPNVVVLGMNFSITF